MFKKQKKRRATKVDSLIGQSSLVEGDIRFSGGLHVDGTIRGNVIANDSESSVITVSDRGSIEGEVRVPYVVINGAVKGDVFAYQHVELAPNARVDGDVHYNLIEMAMGAEVNGKLVHISEDEQANLALEHDVPVKVLENS